MEEVFQAPQVAADRGSETMLAPQDVQRMLALQAKLEASKAWFSLSAGEPRGLAYMGASGQPAETKQSRAEQFTAVLLGEAPLPWQRK